MYVLDDKKSLTESLIIENRKGQLFGEHTTDILTSRGFLKRD